MQAGDISLHTWHSVERGETIAALLIRTSKMEILFAIDSKHAYQNIISKLYLILKLKLNCLYNFYIFIV